MTGAGIIPLPLRLWQLIVPNPVEGRHNRPRPAQYRRRPRPCVLAFQADRGCGVDDHTRVATMTLRLGPKVTGALERNLDPVDRPWQPIMRRRKFLRFRHLGMSLLRKHAA